MKRARLLPVLALALVAPAAAQVMQVPVIRPNVPVETVPQIQNLPTTQEVGINEDVIAMDPERARATINQLRKDKRELNAKLKDALAKIDQITSPGGSLVRAYCSDEYTSRNTAGAEEKCGQYTCHQVSGLCNRSATSTAMCGPGYVWDGGNQCVMPPRGE